jgi:hypothetical protein
MASYDVLAEQQRFTGREELSRGMLLLTLSLQLQSHVHKVR